MPVADPHGISAGQISSNERKRQADNWQGGGGKKLKLKQANIENRKYPTSRNGHPLCMGYNDGSCTNTVNGTWCGTDRSKIHLCSVCLGQHGAQETARCGNTSIPSTSATRFSAGKGRGGGKGGNKGGGGGKGWGKGKGKGKHPW